jgi:UDPglucose 6-dehydrogenase
MPQARQAAPALSYAASAAGAAQDADLILIATGWPEFGVLDPAPNADRITNRAIVDTQGVISGTRWRSAGWTVSGLGYQP